MTIPANLARYDRNETYSWNYENAPDPVDVIVPTASGDWRFSGLPVASPLGIPAGPLLNGRWCMYYASLGFDVLTYKTVRSVERACYALPNLQPVDCGQLHGGEKDLRAVNQMQGSWAVSFGMPSKSPNVWRADVEWTRAQLPRGKILSVSVVGTVPDGASIEQLADDYAKCAKWAVDSGADCIETNFSCPNVTTCDGQLFQQPRDAGVVAERVRAAIGKVPYIVKIGHLASRSDGADLLAALAPHVNALAMTNSVAATVTDARGLQMFDGHPRGICGDAVREASVEQTGIYAQLVQETGADIELIGVGGASTAEHVRQYLAAGARAVHIASAAMVNPAVGLEIRRGLSGSVRPSRQSTGVT
jgi:dihydroorotate dehydrogenase